jgi:hypothetical protein
VPSEFISPKSREYFGEGSPSGDDRWSTLLFDDMGMLAGNGGREELGINRALRYSRVSILSYNLICKTPKTMHSKKVMSKKG